MYSKNLQYCRFILNQKKSQILKTCNTVQIEDNDHQLLFAFMALIFDGGPRFSHCYPKHEI